MFAQGPPKIVINLTGSEEVPPVQTEATGVAEIIPAFDSFGYTINATDMKVLQQDMCILANKVNMDL